MEYFDPETQCIEYPVLFRTDQSNHLRMWQVRIRCIKKHTRQNFETIDWDEMKEIQVPILNEYIIQLPEDIISEYYTLTGVQKGKITRSIPTYPNPKNINKKNFRNHLSQAIFECNALYKKKLEQGFTQVETFPVGGSNYCQPIFPMLAKNYKDHKKKVVFPVYVQPKLDGLRCIAFFDQESKQVRLFSRTKKEYPSNEFNDMIQKNLFAFLSEHSGLYLDGELYIHGTKLQTLNHYTRQENLSRELDEEHLQYHIYDVFENNQKPFKERVRILTQLSRLSNLIQVVDTQLVNSQEELDSFYQKYINQGYEGMMIRSLNGPYKGSTQTTTGTRSEHLLKRKEVFTDEFLVVDYTCGTKGKDMHALVWICQTTDKKPFKVVPNLTYEERYKLYKECETEFKTKYMNRLISVEYRNLSIDRVPQHAKAIYFRDVE
jgi:ATP-dependent DNA ligase